MRKNLFTPFRDMYTIDIPGRHDLEMRGDLLDHEFTVERDGREVAKVSKRWFSIRDTYAVNVSGAGEDDPLILAEVLALDLAQSRPRRTRGEGTRGRLTARPPSASAVPEPVTHEPSTDVGPYADVQGPTSR